MITKKKLARAEIEAKVERERIANLPKPKKDLQDVSHALKDWFRKYCERHNLSYTNQHRTLLTDLVFILFSKGLHDNPRMLKVYYNDYIWELQKFVDGIGVKNSC